MSGALQTQLYESIADVPRAAWNALVEGQSCVYAHEFWSVIERSDLNDFRYRYLMFSGRDGVPVGLAAFYSITTDIAIFAPSPFRQILAGLRRVYPGFLKLGMLECGTPITLHSPPFVAGAGVDPTMIITALLDTLERIARAEGQYVIVVRDFEPPAGALRATFEARGYHWGEILPNTYLDIRWTSRDAYLAALKSYYRAKLIKHWKRNVAEGVTHTLVEDFADQAEVLARQWQVVHAGASEFSREVLTAAFYREFSTGLGPRSKVLLFHKGGVLIGHALLLHDGPLLRWLYFGREAAANDGLYLYVGQAVVETAIVLGAQRLELGLTTYSIKQDLGAVMTPIHVALGSAAWGVPPLIRWLYPLLNRPPQITQRQVFKQDPGREPGARGRRGDP